MCIHVHMSIMSCLGLFACICIYIYTMCIYIIYTCTYARTCTCIHTYIYGLSGQLFQGSLALSSSTAPGSGLRVSGCKARLSWTKPMYSTLNFNIIRTLDFYVVGIVFRSGKVLFLWIPGQQSLFWYLDPESNQGTL